MNRGSFLKQTLLASAYLSLPAVQAQPGNKTIINMPIDRMEKNNICTTCGTRYSNAAFNAAACPVCLDDRQYLGEDGQQWTSCQTLAKSRTIRFHQLQNNLFDLRITPSFAIGQKAHLVLSPSGNILWDCLPFLDDPGVAFIRSLGGLKAIAISHPHYYGLMAEWARRFDCPIYLHAADRQWVMDESKQIVFWDGREQALWDGIKIVHTGGHFAGSTVLHLPHHGAKGSLLTGDSIYVSKDGRQLSAMYSYPNMIPLPAQAINYLVQQVKPLAFDSLYGAFEWMNIPDGAHAIFERSMHRYLGILTSA